MSDLLVKKKVLRGGAYLVEDSLPEETFIPEEFNEEQKMVQDMVRTFVDTEVHPNRDKIERQKDHITERLLEKMGELGLLGAHIPEEYGGMGLDFNTNTIIAELMGPCSSFIVSFAAHIGIGMSPIYYFGTEEQKQKFLPQLTTGKLKAAYCLTEPDSGSDALAAKTRADLSGDGKHYLLNGQKMWITNAGFADIFIVFAQVGGDKFTGFIVERNSEGLTFGQEEEKMGIKGSSTRQVFFENVKVPVENVLGEIGKGHLIAFNALNIGRYKLGVMSIGGCKGVVNLAVKYANERHQFKQAISGFGAIQFKLAEMTIQTFVGESSMYRVSDFMQDSIARNYSAGGDDHAAAQLKAAEEYAIECAILKVYCSEVLDYCVDENVQVHGGVGFSEEYLACRAYRDARINRIYEGTNEINRLLMIDMLFRRALKGAIDLVGPAWAVQKELSSMPGMDRPEGAFGEERQALKDFKKITLMTAGAAAKMQMDGKLNLKEEQEIVMNIADMMIAVFNAESLLLRMEKLAGKDKPMPQDVYDAILKVFYHDTTGRIQRYATDALASFAEGDLLKTFMMGLKRFTKYPPQNVKDLRRKIAAQLIEANGYCF